MHEKSILAVYKKNKIYTQLFTGSWKLPCTGNLRRPHLKTTNKNWVAKFERAFATSWQSWLIPLLASRWHCLCCLTISRMRYWAIAAGYVFFFFSYFVLLQASPVLALVDLLFLLPWNSRRVVWIMKISAERPSTQLSATIVWNVNFGCTIPLIKDSGAMMWACFFASMQCDCFYACALLAPVISVQSVASEVWLIFSCI